MNQATNKPSILFDIALPDDSVLQATLDFVDSFKIDDLAVESDSIIASRPSFSHSAQRVRAELSYLRDLVVELEEQLGDLKGRSVRSMVRQGWEAVALHNKHRRRQAEVKNTKLRALLQKQTLTVKRLESMLHKSCWDVDVHRLQNPRRHRLESPEHQSSQLPQPVPALTA